MAKSGFSRRSVIKGIATTTVLTPALLSEAVAPNNKQTKATAQNRLPEALG